MIRALLLPVLLVSSPMLKAAGAPAVPEALVTELNKRWPANRTINLVYHGHSVPSGYQYGGEVKPFEAYPLLTLRLIKERYPLAVVNTILTSIGGETSVKGAARFEKDVLPMKPDVVFIDYALNDRRETEADVEKAWRSMARAARKAGITVVFVTPTGASDVKIGDPAEPLERRAEIIRRVATEERVLLADVWVAWKEELAKGTQQSELLSSVNHPNERGNQIAARTLAALFLPK